MDRVGVDLVCYEQQGQQGKDKNSLMTHSAGLHAGLEVQLGFSSDTDFIEMAQQIGRILVDAVGPGALQFFLSVASRQETDAERPCPAGGQHIPDAVTDDEDRKSVV